MVTFDTCGLYFQSKTTLMSRITAIDSIIAALLAAQADAAAGINTSEYQLNDGQTIIKQVARGPKAIAEAIMSWESIQQMYINRVNGRVRRLVDVKNFTSPYGGTR